jgi:hypothetical protein
MEPNGATADKQGLVCYGPAGPQAPRLVQIGLALSAF